MSVAATQAGVLEWHQAFVAVAFYAFIILVLKVIFRD